MASTVELKRDMKTRIEELNEKIAALTRERDALDGALEVLSSKNGSGRAANQLFGNGKSKHTRKTYDRPVEEYVLDAIKNTKGWFDIREATAMVDDRFPIGMPYATVASGLRRLHKSGVIRADADGRKLIYNAD